MGKKKTMDGNEAAAYASYAFTEVAAIYPITPSSPMAESVDEWSARGMKNIFGQTVKVVEMQSEAGAAGTMHGSLAAGALTTTYTASQGLLLMIPNMYKIAGELLPGVFHVSARAIATHALSIFGDHQDVMACRQTGVAMLASANVQEAMDMGFITHLSAIKSRIPFIHFFDGFRTSHEYQKINTTNYTDIAKLVDYDSIKNFRTRALNPQHPVVRGTAQNPDIYFQGREAANSFYDRIPEIVEYYMKEYSSITGREYKLFDYYGAPDAEYVIVAMGSVCDTTEEVVDYLNSRGEKTGLVKVHLYRPFSEKHFISALPATVKKIAVLDRTKEPGAPGEPLYLDVVKVLSKFQSIYQCRKSINGNNGNNSNNSNNSNNGNSKSIYNIGDIDGIKNSPIIIGGRYGLGSKDTRPSQILAVFNNLKTDESKDRFTIGIIDDVTGLSLAEEEIINTAPEGTINCKFWGLGSDGTVGANKSAIKIIGDNTDLYAQGYFSYDSKKSGGTTISHLRFGKKPIKSSYLIYNADYIACHNKSFIYHYDVLKGLKKKGTFVLNCPWKPEELDEKLPVSMKKYMVENDINFYIIDAIDIAEEIGLGNRINMIMQSAFFKLANVIPLDDAVRLLKESIEKTYGKKGKEIVNMNNEAVNRGIAALDKIHIPVSWADIDEAVNKNPISRITTIKSEEPDFVANIQIPIARHEGDELPVSAFNGMEDGSYPLGTTAYEKRGIAVFIPQWQMEKCIQCNRCSYVCPHATVRAFLLNKDEINNAPDTFKTLKAAGKSLEDYEYRIQISPLDCTGCGNCADVCPAKGKALVMMPAEDEIENQTGNWEYAMTITEKKDLMELETLKGSQFARPLLEFNGACPGCGETPYIKLLTQLYGERMMIANATGCSSIWAASAPSIAYTTNHEGKGPAWANSLFEDNAEYGYGMYLGVKQIRDRLEALIKEEIGDKEIGDSPAQIEHIAGDSPSLKSAFLEWLENKEDGTGSKAASHKILDILSKYDYRGNKILEEIMDKKDFLVKPSVWIIGGDGWAYDIGFGGLDHVLASGDDVNIFVMDTEVYSNTGGQSSKATPAAAVAKFAASGKRTGKKDLGLIAMTYGHVYVAQIAMGADMNQTMKAIAEAERYKGPSLIIAYSPCINHGIKTGMGTSIMEEKKAVETGYWQLYRFNPDLKKHGKNSFALDSKEPKESFIDFIKGEIRYSQLSNTYPDRAGELFDIAEKNAVERYEIYRKLADTY
ncbi:MAG TPA: pyruvate:ferredoxin (flavodoxin) oxidoreductase [Clostridiales bacterium]|nr:pyruvate:ferredoxin (flavodoxin) oxidoreductase [Clostridiales bacterium]